MDHQDLKDLEFRAWELGLWDNYLNLPIDYNRDRLIEHYWPATYIAASQIWPHIPLPMRRLISFGEARNLSGYAIMFCIPRYDRDTHQNVPFLIYAWKRMIGIVIDEVRSFSWRGRYDPPDLKRKAEYDYEGKALEIAATGDSLEDLLIASIETIEISDLIYKTLSDKEIDVMRLLMQGLTEKQVGHLYRVTESRICQVRIQYMEKLRRALAAADRAYT